MAKNEIKFKVDARSLRSFKKNIDVAFQGIAACTKEEIVDFCELVLLDATQLVTIDTGALAHSADFKITGTKKKGFKAKMGYGIGKRNPVNKRTGKKASTYAAAAHEQMKPHYNGQSKFFEQALYLHEDELETKTGQSIRKYLSSRVVQPKEEPGDTNDKYEAQRENVLQARMNQGFTADVDGKYLPFPVPQGMVFMKGGRYFLVREAFKKQKDRRPKSVRQHKSTGQTAYQHRSKEIHRYMTERAPVKKKSPKKSRPKGKASKVSKKQSKMSKATKGTRTAADRKTPKKTKQKRKFIGDLAHETALDEFMEALMDGDKEEDK